MPNHRKDDLTARIMEMRKTMKIHEVAKALGLTDAAIVYHICKYNRNKNAIDFRPKRA